MQFFHNVFHLQMSGRGRRPVLSLLGVSNIRKASVMCCATLEHTCISTGPVRFPKRVKNILAVIITCGPQYIKDTQCIIVLKFHGGGLFQQAHEVVQ